MPVNGQMSEYEKLRERLVNDLSVQFPSLNISGEYPPKSMVGFVDKNKPHIHVVRDNPVNDRWYQQWDADTRYYNPVSTWCEFNGSGNEYLGRVDISRPTQSGYEKIEGYDSLPEMASIVPVEKQQNNDIDARMLKIEDAMSKLIGMVENVLENANQKVEVKEEAKSEGVILKKKAGRPKRNVSENGEIAK